MKKFFLIIFSICITFLGSNKVIAANNSDIREQARILYMGNQLDAVRQSLETIPANEKIAEDYFMIGLATEDMRAAIRAYYAAIKINPDFYQAYYNIGSLYMGVNNYNRALDYFKLALKGNKNSEYTHYNMGCAYLALGDWSSARKSFDSAIKINSLEPDYYYNLAYTYKKMGNEKRAQKAIDLYNELIRKRNEV